MKRIPGSSDLNAMRRAVMRGIGAVAATATYRGVRAAAAACGTATPAREAAAAARETAASACETATGDLGSLSDIRGTTIRRGSPHYEVWRQSMIWQRRKSSRYPDLVVQAESVDDVVAAIRYAEKQRLRVTTRCGGHSMSASFLRDGGMLIDVSRLSAIEVDATRREVRAGPGVIARGLSEKLREVGLAFPTAHCGMVPIGGFLLGGGLGLNGNHWGEMSTFNVAAVEIVTADGEVRTAGPSENQDLYWAARGAGPGLFGVVTKFHLRAFDLPSAVVGNTLTFDFSDIVPVASALAQIGPRMDRDVELLGYVGPAPADWTSTASNPGQPLAMYVDANAYTTSTREAARKLAPLLRHAVADRAKVRDLGHTKTIEELYFEEELGFSQRRWSGDNVFTNRIADVAAVLQRRMPSCPAKDAQAVFLYKGHPKLPDAACSTMGEFYAAYYLLWDNPTQDKIMLDYLVDLYRDIVPLGVGSNINEMNQEGRPQDIHTCYTRAAWSRLADLRAKWDPTGVFHDFYGMT
jgi:FAD/FMN-containing dehydrogenase